MKRALLWLAGIAIVATWAGAAFVTLTLATQAFCWRIAEAIEDPGFRAERQRAAETHDQWLMQGHGTDLLSESQWLERVLQHGGKKRPGDEAEAHDGGQK